MHGHSGTVYLCSIWLYLNKPNNTGQPPYFSIIDFKLDCNLNSLSYSEDIYGPAQTAKNYALPGSRG